MIRTILVPENKRIVFFMPKEYVGKRGRVIILPEDKYIRTEKKKISFTSISLDTRGWKFNREEAEDLQHKQIYRR
jgi:hypothetical protein